MRPESPLWYLEPHTVGKHKVLRYYLDAWLPILSSRNDRILFIDAFAGPGEYAKGEPGSPVIALQAFDEHPRKSQMVGEIKYLFIEKDPRHSAHLEKVLANLPIRLPSNCGYEVITGTFDATLTDVLNSLDEQQSRLAPAFVMIDPFGVSETPMNVIARILANSKSEVYVTFMYEAIQRFKAHPHFQQPLDSLYGCSEWLDGLNISDTKEEKDFFFDLYRRQLKRNGAQYVVHFELYEGNRLVYAIFFGTNDLTGCDKMKRAIWKVAPFGDFKFRSIHLNQFTLGPEMTDFTPLKLALQERFAGHDWQKIEDIVNFVKSDATDFHSGQLKRKTLMPMENNGEIEVCFNGKRRPGDFPDGTEIRFLGQRMSL